VLGLLKQLQGVALVGDSPFVLDGAGEKSLGGAPAILHFEQFDQGLGFVGVLCDTFRVRWLGAVVWNPLRDLLGHSNIFWRISKRVGSCFLFILLRLICWLVVCFWRLQKRFQLLNSNLGGLTFSFEFL
jgi:hypothetical protein